MIRNNAQSNISEISLLYTLGVLLTILLRAL